MRVRRVQPARFGLFILAAIWILMILPLSAMAAPYAAYVIDARTGEVLHSQNADTRLHPASLTKMMTLYIAFEAIKRGEISLDSKVKITSHDASEPPSKLGLKSGQTISLRYLIRAAAVKSANDAATAIGEAIEGSEANFARRMNRTAKALGMTNTTFKNAHGLTESGHMSTAHDMTIMGRHLLYDHPEYYNLFSRITADAGVRKVSHTNRRFLGSYKGADGIKTGFARAAGFNLTASAERGNERVIVTVFGGTSTSARNAKVTELMDLGFRRAPSSAPLNKPSKPAYADIEDTPVASNGGAGKVIRLVGAVTSSKRPTLRPGHQAQVVVATAEAPQATSPILNADITAALQEAQKTAPAIVAAAPAPDPAPLCRRIAGRNSRCQTDHPQSAPRTRSHHAGFHLWWPSLGRQRGSLSQPLCRRENPAKDRFGRNLDPRREPAQSRAPPAGVRRQLPWHDPRDSRSGLPPLGRPQCELLYDRAKLLSLACSGRRLQQGARIV